MVVLLRVHFSFRTNTQITQQFKSSIVEAMKLVSLALPPGTILNTGVREPMMIGWQKWPVIGIQIKFTFFLKWMSTNILFKINHRTICQHHWWICNWCSSSLSKSWRQYPIPNDEWSILCLWFLHCCSFGKSTNVALYSSLQNASQMPW